MIVNEIVTNEVLTQLQILTQLQSTITQLMLVCNMSTVQIITHLHQMM